MRCENKYGTVIKRETIGNAHDCSVDNMLILQAKDPYPGYFCPEKSTPPLCKSGTYFLPHLQPACCPDDHICRVSLEASNELQINTCLAYITINGRLTRAFRLKETPADRISDALRFFKTAGIETAPFRKIDTHLSEIYIKSFQCLVKIDANIFRNRILNNHYYLKIPQKISWDLFEKLITFQKNNNELNNFDAATGYWIQSPVFSDFIRIFGPKLSHQQLSEIRNTFLDIYTKYINKEITL